MTLRADRFSEFFREIWGRPAYPWQQKLAEKVCAGSWPHVMDLPTGSGKTACLDVAVFALAIQADLPAAKRTVGRRVFFVVNRRVIVDEAYGRAKEIAEKLLSAPRGSVTRNVADGLRKLSGDDDAPPLDVAVLRGGIYRDNRWARSVTQPTIITSTIDQIGSRMLFRGFGVSEGARPLHAALVTNDSLLLLDEAHISQPFAQALDAVKRYRGETWAAEPIATCLDIVQMTATPMTSDLVLDIFRLGDDDREVLKRRLSASKRVNLPKPVKKRDGETDEMARAAVEEAQRLQSDGRETVAVVVNRVATARKIYEILKDNQGDKAEVHLAIGRMRPIDRDRVTAAIEARVGKARRQGALEKPVFVVATQCLEVGADFDFDAMVSECASLDALRQRFGRLNRAGRGIDARGCILIRHEQRNDKEDPIYGGALSETWTWLESVAKKGKKEKGNEAAVDFGISAMERTLSGTDIDPLLAPRMDGPIMFPAYVDAWAQTSPSPMPDPDVSLFLHGPERGEPDVQVCWRSDLSGEPDEEEWAQVVSLCPPSGCECMPVPIGAFRRWMVGEDAPDEGRGDTLEGSTPEEADDKRKRGRGRAVLAWRGPSSSRIVRKAGDIRPGDTLVLSIEQGGWNVFGHIPDAPGESDAARRVDVGEEAFRESRSRAIMRLTPSRLACWPKSEALGTLREWVSNRETDVRVDAAQKVLREIADAMPAEAADEAEALRLLGDKTYGLTLQRYPASMEGIVLTTRRRVTDDRFFLPAMDDGGDETSRRRTRGRVSLEEHSRHVLEILQEVLPKLSLNRLEGAILAAARLHDLGKADERFQALLLNGSVEDAWAQPTLWAKSSRMALTPEQRAEAYRRSSLPKGFRHEMLSAQLAKRAADLPDEPVLRDLALHLVASHHGYGRPFAPMVPDEDPPDVEVGGLRLAGDERTALPAHRLDSGIAERFWAMTRRFGWWGLAYLEAVLRLADQRASQREEEAEEARA